MCRDSAQASRHENDPYCGYIFTINGFYNMFNLLNFIIKKEHINSIPKDLPILICSGDMDPVGKYGSGPKTVYKSFVDAKILDVVIKLYKDDRHEILNELDQDQVYDDILN